MTVISIVELQFIADQIKANTAICKHFTTAPTGAADFATFFKTINNQPNLEFVEGDVNNAKGKLFAGQTLLATTSKAAVGLPSLECILLWFSNGSVVGRGGKLHGITEGYKDHEGCQCY